MHCVRGSSRCPWEPQNWSILPDFNSSSLQATQGCSALEEPGQHPFSRMLWCYFSAPLVSWPSWEHMPRLSPEFNNAASNRTLGSKAIPNVMPRNYCFGCCLLVSEQLLQKPVTQKSPLLAPSVRPVGESSVLGNVTACIILVKDPVNLNFRSC